MSGLPVRRCLWCKSEKPCSLLLPMCLDCYEVERQKVVREWLAGPRQDAAAAAGVAEERNR
jgi:hypothetical protein